LIKFFQNYGSNEPVETKSQPFWKAVLLHIASARGLFTRILVSGRTCPLKSGEIQGF
jgi:hypothetical protein